MVVLGAGGAARAAAFALRRTRGRRSRSWPAIPRRPPSSRPRRRLRSRRPRVRWPLHPFDILDQRDPARVGGRARPDARAREPPSPRGRWSSTWSTSRGSRRASCATREAAGCVDHRRPARCCVAQAAAQFETWTGAKAPVGRDAQAALDLDARGRRERRYSRQERFAGPRPRGPGAHSRGPGRVVGVGALGSVLAEMMARAGVGAPDPRRPRLRRGVEPAAAVPVRRGGRGARVCPRRWPRRRGCGAINSEVDVRGRGGRLRDRQRARPGGHADLVLDGTDNFEARFLLNDVCLRAGIPWVYGACVGRPRPGPRWFGPGVSPCLRCVLRRDARAGLRAHLRHGRGRGARSSTWSRASRPREALKLLAGRDERLLPGLVTVDLWSGVFEVMDLRGRGAVVPGLHRGALRLRRRHGPAVAAVLCGRDAVQLRPQGGAARPARPRRPPARPRATSPPTSTWCASRAAGAELVVFGDGRAHRQGRERRGRGPARSTPATWGTDDGRRAQPSADPDPARRAVLRGRRGPPPPRASRDA